jgi:O-antigen/teichoic acid export membrane protein
LLFGEDLLALVGPTYAAGYVALSVAVLFNATMTLGAFSDQFVAGLGRTHVIPLAQAVFFMASVGLNFVLIPIFGIPGAALASGVAYLLGGAINFGALWRYNRGSVLLLEYWKPFLGGLLMLAPAAAAGLWLDLSFASRVAILVVCLTPFALYARRYWKRFNAAS